MSYEINGKLIEKFDTEQITDSFRKREFVLEKNEMVNDRQFTDTIKFQLTQDRCDLLDNIELGEEIKLSFNIRGRRWEKNDRVYYINNLEAWRIEKNNNANELPPVPDVQDQPAQKQDEDYADDLPF